MDTRAIGDPEGALTTAWGRSLVSIQQDLGAERRMPGHLDRQVPPLPVHDVEAVVIHVRTLPGQVADHRAIRGPAHIPHHRRGPGDQDHEHSRPHRMRAQVLLGDQVLAFPRRAVDHRDGVAGGPGPDPPREPPRQAHQVSVVQHRIRLGLRGTSRQPDCPEGAIPSGRSPGRNVRLLPSTREGAAHSAAGPPAWPGSRPGEMTRRPSGRAADLPPAG